MTQIVNGSKFHIHAMQSCKFLWKTFHILKYHQALSNAECQVVANFMKETLPFQSGIAVIFFPEIWMK